MFPLNEKNDFSQLKVCLFNPHFAMSLHILLFFAVSYYGLLPSLVSGLITFCSCLIFLGQQDLTYSAAHNSYIHRAALRPHDIGCSQQCSDQQSIKAAAVCRVTCCGTLMAGSVGGERRPGASSKCSRARASPHVITPLKWPH